MRWRVVSEHVVHNGAWRPGYPAQAVQRFKELFDIEALAKTFCNEEPVVRFLRGDGDHGRDWELDFFGL